MTRYILRRIVSSIFVLFFVLTFSLWITRLAPSNPCQKEKEAATCECMENHGLDRPVFPVYTENKDPKCTPWQEYAEPTPGSVDLGPVSVLAPGHWGETQYFRYVGGLVTGDLGESMRHNNATVNDLLWERLPRTMQLGFQALLLALIIGIPAGMYAGLKQNTFADYSTMTVAMAGVAIPNFVLGPLLILVFAKGQMGLGWVDPGGWDTASDTILPTITLSLYYAAYIARLTRGGMLEMIRKDFVRTARSKGLSERAVVFRHSLKGTVLPVVSYLGPAFAALLTGSVVVEQIFNIPGIGKFFVESALNRNYPVLLGAVLVYASLLIVLNLLVDILYTVIDPRVDYDER